MIDASIILKNGDKARVISPEFTYDPSGLCLTWFYHMYGKCQLNEEFISLSLHKTMIL
jgi:hypothetical protein